MAKTIAIVILLLFALLLTSIAVIAIFAFNFFPFGEDLTTYEESFTYQYQTDTPADIEEVLIETDISKTYVEFTSEASAPVVKAVMDFKITGPGAADKDYTEWFEPIEWIDDSSPITFRLESKPTSFLEGGWFNENELKITLRSDVIFDLEVIVTTGGMDVIVPTGIILEDLDLDSTTGLLQLVATDATINMGINAITTTGGNEIELTNCVIGGDIAQKSTTGLVTYVNDDVYFTKDTDVSIDCTTGGINFDINQEQDLGGDVSIIMTSTTGNIDGTYVDTNSNVGARFEGEVTTGVINYNSPSGGFNKSGDTYQSSDFNSATHVYDVMMSATTGSINLDASSA